MGVIVSPGIWRIPQVRRTLNRSCICATADDSCAWDTFVPTDFFGMIMIRRLRRRGLFKPRPSALVQFGWLLRLICVHATPPLCPGMQLMRRRLLRIPGNREVLPITMTGRGH
jgi:hypothetical protein